MWAQNGDVKYCDKDGNEANQLIDKLVAFRPGNVFGDGGTKPADQSLKALEHFRKPKWVAKLLMWALFFDSLNENDINKDRILVPVPALQRSYQQKHGEMLQHQRLQTYILYVLEYCSRRDASAASDIEALLKTRFNAGGTALAALGLGSAQKSVRRGWWHAGRLPSQEAAHIHCLAASCANQNQAW